MVMLRSVQAEMAVPADTARGRGRGPNDPMTAERFARRRGSDELDRCAVVLVRTNASKIRDEKERLSPSLSVGLSP
jgi:hypothetical protein